MRSVNLLDKQTIFIADIATFLRCSKDGGYLVGENEKTRQQHTCSGLNFSIIKILSVEQ
jgi:hypothetical protein